MVYAQETNGIDPLYWQLAQNVTTIEKEKDDLILSFMAKYEGTGTR